MFNINNNELSYGRGYVYSLQYHLVWCTKYRKKVLKDGIDTERKEMLCDLAEEYKFQILAMEVICVVLRFGGSGCNVRNHSFNLVFHKLSPSLHE